MLIGVLLLRRDPPAINLNFVFAFATGMFLALTPVTISKDYALRNGAIKLKA